MNMECSAELSEFRKANWADFVESRSRYLKNRIADIIVGIADIRKKALNASDDDRGLAEMFINDMVREVRRLFSELKAINDTGEHQLITTEQIMRARDVSIRYILNANARGNVSCPFHTDRHPSMGIKNNRFHCFSCGAKGDAIELYMRLHDVDFVHAVRALCEAIDA